MNIIDIALDAQQRFRNHTDPPRDLYGWCQAFAAWCVVAYQDGSEQGVTWYDPADAAREASDLLDITDINDPQLQVGDNLFWDEIDDGHVALVVGRQHGRTLVVHTGTRHCDTVLDLGHSLRVSHADTMGYRFAGASRRNGQNARIVAEPWRTDPAPSAGTYTVVKGDTLSEIAARHGTTWPVLQQLNGIADPDLIHPGQVLRLPARTTSGSYTVQRGDTLSEIAARYGTTWPVLQQLNGIANPDLIHPGQVIRLP